VPPALLEFGPVVVLEPRRVAADVGARVAEMGEELGETVGYQCGLKRRRAAHWFLTEGVLTGDCCDTTLRGVIDSVLDVS
jgi:HrpA-like RNA helicase